MEVTCVGERIPQFGMNPVGELLTVDDVCLDIDAPDKTVLLEQIATTLAARHGLSKKLVLESLWAREQLGSTGVGHGVAIPHARMGQCAIPAAAFVRTLHPIPFDAPDGKAVSVFLGLIVPNTATQYHLQLLATAAGMLNDKIFLEKLKTIKEPGVVRTLLTTWPNAQAI
jgi:nitrogen PTS system EIIA component